MQLSIWYDVAVCMLISKLRPFSHHENNPWYSLNRRLVGPPRAILEAVEKGKISCLSGYRTTIPRSSISQINIKLALI